MRISISSLVLFLVFTFLSKLSLAIGPVGKSEFESIKKVSEHILKEFPKDQYAYIGVGRSPVAIQAFIQTEKDTVAYSFPFSARGDRKASDRKKLDVTQENRLFDHLDLVFPKPDQLKGRKKIVLMDFAMSGTVLHLAREYIEKYIQSRKLGLEVEVVGITEPEQAARIKQEYPDLKNLITLNMMDHFFVKMATKIFVLHSEYGACNIRQEGALPIPLRRPEYQEYVKAMITAKQSPESLDDKINTQLLQAAMEFSSSCDEDVVKMEMAKFRQKYEQLLLCDVPEVNTQVASQKQSGSNEDSSRKAETVTTGSVAH